MLTDIKFENINLILFGAAFVLLYIILQIVLRLINKKKTQVSFYSLFLKLAVVFFLLCALAGPYRENSSESSRALALIDISESNNETVMRDLLEQAKTYEQKGVDLSFIPFAGSAGSKVYTPDNYRQIKNDNSRLDIGKTNIQSALESLQGNDPGSILLISDGYETQGTLAASLALLSRGGYRIFPIVPQNAGDGVQKFSISNLYAPEIAPSEKSVDVRVSVINSSLHEQTGMLDVQHDGKTIFSKRVQIEAGKEAIFTAQSDPSKEGIKEITAVLRPDTKDFAPSSETVYLSGETREKVLLLSGTSEDQRFLKQALENQSYQVKTSVGSDSAETLTDLSQYSVVIFNNIALNQLPKGAAGKIEAYVDSGGAFVMLGGNKSFGLGGYINSSIEDVLPVNLVPPQTVEKRLNLAVQLLLDKSKSMAEGDKIDFAKEAAVKIVDNLKDEDYIGVLGFDTNPFVVIRIAKVADIRDEAERRINLLYPNKGTSLVGSLDEARRDLMRVNAGRKHMLVLTDGEITDAPKQYYYELIKQIRLLGITVSTVMLGSEGDETMLKQMADIGGGAFYITTNARSLPQIFISDLKVASGERTMKEQTDYAVRIGPSDLKSTTVSSFPHVKGYVQTKIKARADLELVATAENKAEPLLASWSYGKGKTVAFTSDANGRWSSEWIDWSRFQQFWSDVIDSVRSESKSEQEKIKFDLRSYYQQGALNLDLSIFSGEQRGAPEAELILPGGEKTKITFKSIAAGRYQALLDNPKAGKYEFHAKVGNTSLTPVAFNLSGELFGEKKGQGFNMPVLRNIAASTAGKINPSPEELKQQVYVQTIKKDLTHYAMLLALLVFVLEVFWREVFSFRRKVIFRAGI